MRLTEIENSDHFNQRIEEVRSLLRPYTELVIFHKKFRQAFDELLRLIVSLPPGSLVYLIGPTGVGKTALIRTLMNRFNPSEGSVSTLTKSENNSPNRKPSSTFRSPPIYVEAASPQKHAFEWRDFDIRMLRQLQEPGIWYKTDLDFELKQLREGLAKSNNSRRLPPDWLLFQCLEQALRVRRPPFACIDEIHNIIKMVLSAATFEDQMDILKSIANLSKVTLLLSGTYKTKNLIYEGDETARRSRVVHFGRYLNTGQDLEDFQDYLAALTENSPIPLDFEPLEHLRFFYSSCAGCAGTLKDWFSTSNSVALLDDRSHVQIDDFKGTALDRKQLVKLIKEINAFERHFADCPEANVIDTFWDIGRNDQLENMSNKTIAASASKKRNNHCRRPGEMNPTRFLLDEDKSDDNTHDP